ncbi:MAG: hypothetical protein FWG89_11165 [Treponema sp.]|nr:hypothetical protein [Treponema sp.]
MQHSGNVSNRFPLISINDGGKVILNGGALRNNVLSAASNDGALRGGAIRVGGGSFGGYMLINSGDVSGNTVNMGIADAGSHGGAGGVYLYQYGVLVMHGGAITNNTFNFTNTAASTTPKAGGVADHTATTGGQNHGQSAFFMTGGDISGNRVTGTVTAASAGGVVISGTFQKNGGTIYGMDAANEAMRNRNETGGTGNTKVSAAAVYMVASANPNPNAATPQAMVRETTAGPAITLFVDSYKPGHTSTAVNSVPEWTRSFWDNQQ